MIVQIRFRSIEEAESWVRDARLKMALPGQAGLRRLELDDVRRDRAVDRYLVTRDPGDAEWRVPPL